MKSAPGICLDVCLRLDFNKSKKYEQPIIFSHELKFEPCSLQLGITEEELRINR